MTALPSQESQVAWVAECNCRSSLNHVVNQIEASFRPDEQQRAQPQQTLSRHIPLDERLVLGEALVMQWELLNGCAHSASHLGPALLRCVCDAVAHMLTLYELALLEEDALNGQTAVGTLELDEADEVQAVARAALSWGVVRLGAVLQDVEEESQTYSAEKLREANHVAVKDLTSRTLRLLAEVETVGERR